MFLNMNATRMSLQSPAARQSRRWLSQSSQSVENEAEKVAVRSGRRQTAPLVPPKHETLSESERSTDSTY